MVTEKSCNLLEQKLGLPCFTRKETVKVIPRKKISPQHSLKQGPHIYDDKTLCIFPNIPSIMNSSYN